MFFLISFFRIPFCELLFPTFYHDNILHRCIIDYRALSYELCVYFLEWGWGVGEIPVLTKIPFYLQNTIQQKTQGAAAFYIVCYI